ncbi:MAG: 3-phosphoserine/phosphohydroxythreonine transaminase [Oscillospiraceae bacterium]|nr:3-phosphoserine/phosphohydroxythreonine transaminase [Oscillospiraceae bacterium]
MERVYNFSAGPSMMPVEILQQAQQDLVCYPGAGCSVMEMSHRSAPFEAIIAEAEASLRRLMRIPDDYAVLFLQGGASMQFSAVPMNLARQGQTLDYAVTGQFAGKALTEGERWGKAVAVTSSKADTFSHIPKITADMLDPDAAYLHITGNNTIFGTSYNTLPETGAIPLVADWSSAILGREIDVAAHALIYAGAQKNMGPAGLTVVILRRELLEREVDPVVPAMLRYKLMADNGSMYNTPPCFSIYMAGLMFQWVEKMGGVAAMEKRNREKAALLYDFIGRSAMFHNPVAVEDRSIMNVTFTLPTPEDTKAFLQMAEGRGMINLKGHRSVGGCRASIYNGMPTEGVEALVACMKDYEMGLRK